MAVAVQPSAQGPNQRPMKRADNTAVCCSDLISDPMAASLTYSTQLRVRPSSARNPMPSGAGQADRPLSAPSCCRRGARAFVPDIAARTTRRRRFRPMWRDGGGARRACPDGKGWIRTNQEHKFGHTPLPYSARLGRIRRERPRSPRIIRIRLYLPAAPPGILRE